MRLGNSKDGAKNIKAHIYFDGVDWDAMYNLEVSPPFVPDIVSRLQNSTPILITCKFDFTKHSF